MGGWGRAPRGRRRGSSEEEEEDDFNGVAEEDVQVTRRQIYIYIYIYIYIIDGNIYR